MNEAKITIEILRNLIESSMEPAEPQNKLLTALRARNGKKLTERLMPKIREEVGDASLRIEHIAGMTKIAWGDRNNEASLGSILISHGVPEIDADSIQSKNTHCYEGRLRRNDQRGEALVSPELLARLANAINAKIAAEAALVALFEHDQPLEAVEYRVRELWLKSTKRFWPCRPR